MKKSTQAALLSALVFPGVGHLFLKKYISGLVLFGVSGAGLWYLLTKAVEKTLFIVEKIQVGDVPPDVAAILDLVAKQSTASEAQIANLATAVLAVCWLISILDSYRVGLGQDKVAKIHCS